MIHNISGRDYFSDDNGVLRPTLPAKYSRTPLNQILWWWFFRKNTISIRGYALKNWQLLVSIVMFILMIQSFMTSRTEYIVEQRESIRFIPGPTDTITQTDTMSIIEILFADDNKNEKVKKKRKKATQADILNYLSKHRLLAQNESRKSGVPASIILAQALLESGAGLSQLAVESNNHFGIKCFAKNCKKGHCDNYTDDTHKDFFRNFGSTAESFHAHTQFLQAKRYTKVRNARNYKEAAYALKAAGYATDPQYPQKLIGIIKAYRLWELD